METRGPSEYAIATAAALLLSDSDTQEREPIRSLFPQERTRNRKGKGNKISKRVMYAYRHLEAMGLIQRVGLQLVVVDRPGLQELVAKGMSAVGNIRKTLGILHAAATQHPAYRTGNQEWIRIDREARTALEALGAIGKPGK